MHNYLYITQKIFDNSPWNIKSIIAILIIKNIIKNNISEITFNHYKCMFLF